MGLAARRGELAIAFVLRRLGALVITLVVASALIYGAMHLAPGGPLALLTGGHTLSRQAIASLKEQYHLNDSLPVGYVRWLTGVLHGNLGESIAQRQPVSGLIGASWHTTALLVIYAFVLITVFGIGSGLVAGLRTGAIGSTVMFGWTLAFAVPPFIAAVGLVSLFAVTLGWFPILGSGSGLFDQLYHLTLPAVALALSVTAYVARITRTSVREETTKDHVQTARSRGLPSSIVVRRHILRNAFIPIATAGALTLASLLAGSVVVEYAFQLNGLGSLLINSVEQKDFAVVQAVSLIFVTVFVVGNTLVDLLYVRLDPRIAKRSAAA